MADSTITPARTYRRASLRLSRQLRILATPETGEAISQLANLEKTSDGEIVRRALNAYLPGAIKTARRRIANKKHRMAKSP